MDVEETKTKDDVSTTIKHQFDTITIQSNVPNTQLMDPLVSPPLNAILSPQHTSLSVPLESLSMEPTSFATQSQSPQQLSFNRTVVPAAFADDLATVSIPYESFDVVSVAEIAKFMEKNEIFFKSLTPKDVEFVSSFIYNFLCSKNPTYVLLFYPFAIYRPYLVCTCAMFVGLVPSILAIDVFQED